MSYTAAMQHYIELCLRPFAVDRIDMPFAYYDEHGNQCFLLLSDPELQAVQLQFMSEAVTYDFLKEEIICGLGELDFTPVDPHMVPSGDATVWIKLNKQQ